MARDVSTDTHSPRDLSYTYTEVLVLLGEDNPPFEGVFEFCSISAGGSIGMCLISCWFSV